MRPPLEDAAGGLRKRASTLAMPNIPRPYRHRLVLVLRAPGDWNPDQSTRILDPARGV